MFLISKKLLFLHSTCTLFEAYRVDQASGHWRNKTSPHTDFQLVRVIGKIDDHSIYKKKVSLHPSPLSPTPCSIMSFKLDIFAHSASWWMRHCNFTILFSIPWSSVFFWRKKTTPLFWQPLMGQHQLLLTPVLRNSDSCLQNIGSCSSVLDRNQLNKVFNNMKIFV